MSRPMRGEGVSLVELLSFAKKAHSFLKRHKLISRSASALDQAGVPHAAQVAKIAKTFGYGGVIVGKDIDGAGIQDLIKFLKKFNSFLRKHKLISKGSKLAAEAGVPGAKPIHKISKSLGYGKRGSGGRRSRSRRGRGVRGCGAYSDPASAQRGELRL